MLERIQKIISAAGVTSRRAAEELIAEGRVRVNGQVVTEPGTKADPSRDHIKVDGKLINPQQPKTYIILNKPAGFVTTMSDPEGRPTVQDLLKGVKVRVYPVGRLDYNTEGMLILTNDGGFAHLITHPKHEFPKTYLAKVKGVLEEGQIGNLEQGIYLDDGKTAPAKIKKVRKEEANSWLEITIHEGRKRQVRRMFDRVGHSVIKLKRIRTGSLVLGNLPEGAFRYLTPAEVIGLKELALRTGTGIPEPVVGRQRAGVRSQKTETGRKERPGVAVQGRGVMEGYGRPAIGARSQKAGAGRFRIPAMQDTTDGRRKNQIARVSAPQEKQSYEAPRSTAGSRPRAEITNMPTARPAKSRLTMRTVNGRPAPRGTTGKPEARQKPDQRPWPGTRKNGPGRKGPGSVTGYGQRSFSGTRPATRFASSRPSTSAGVGRPASGTFQGKPESRRKQAPRSWPGASSSDARSKGPGYESRDGSRRPSSGPRPNKSTHTGGKGPRRMNRPAGSRGPGQGAGKRGPRR